MTQRLRPEKSEVERLLEVMKNKKFNQGGSLLTA
jgi:hypothetical protein